MRITTLQKRLKEVEEVVESYSECDKCKGRIRPQPYDAFQCELFIKTGDEFPEGGCGEQVDMELCQECSEGLVKLLKENGYRLNESEWD